MFRKKTVLEVTRQNYGLIAFSDAEIFSIFRNFADVKCKTEKIGFINYYELCQKSFYEKYLLNIIQEDKIIRSTDMESAPCYRMDPFKNATIIAAIMPNLDFVEIFRYNPEPFKGTIYLDEFYDLEPNFGLYNVYVKYEDGTLHLAENFEELSRDDEIFCISKSSLPYSHHGSNYNFSITLQYRPGPF